eukprot:Rhum_TRINITY_DN14334_c5_g1::Rhum_TRINITY_DN14334_c5_g1_i1::g.81946::m.81946
MPRHACEEGVCERDLCGEGVLRQEVALVVDGHAAVGGRQSVERRECAFLVLLRVHRVGGAVDRHDAFGDSTRHRRQHVDERPVLVENHHRPAVVAQGEARLHLPGAVSVLPACEAGGEALDGRHRAVLHHQLLEDDAAVERDDVDGAVRRPRHRLPLVLQRRDGGDGGAVEGLQREQRRQLLEQRLVGLPPHAHGAAAVAGHDVLQPGVHGGDRPAVLAERKHDVVGQIRLGDPPRVVDVRALLEAEEHAVVFRVQRHGADVGAFCNVGVERGRRRWLRRRCGFAGADEDRTVALLGDGPGGQLVVEHRLDVVHAHAWPRNGEEAERAVVQSDVAQKPEGVRHGQAVASADAAVRHGHDLQRCLLRSGASVGAVEQAEVALEHIAGVLCALQDLLQEVARAAAVCHRRRANHMHVVRAATLRCCAPLVG